MGRLNTSAVAAFVGTPVAPLPGRCVETNGDPVARSAAVVNELWKFVNAFPTRSRIAGVATTLINEDSGSVVRSDTLRLSAERSIEKLRRVAPPNNPKLLDTNVAGSIGSEKRSVITEF